MNEFTKSLQDSLFIGSLFIAALFIVCTVSLALRNYEAKQQIKKLKKWRKFSDIEKKQKHHEYDKLASELAEERTFSETQGDMHVRLMLKYAAIQEESDKTKKELKIAQTYLKVAETEITELKSKLSRKNLKRDEKGRVLSKADRDWTTATKDELLAEAKRRYPVGTRVIPFNLSYMSGSPIETKVLGKYEFLLFKGRVAIWVHSGNWSSVIYHDGQWAQIIPNA